MIRKTAAMILSASLVFSSSLCVWAAEEGGALPSDVLNTPYETAVGNLLEKDILSGYPDGLFHPSDKISRAETCVLVVKAMKPDANQLKASEDVTFSDLNGYAWAKPYIDYAVSRGIVSGSGNGQFQPASDVSYVEAAAMMLNAIGYTSKNLKGEWPNNYTNKARELGVFKTVADPVSLNINMTASRGDVANMLDFTAEEIEKADIQPLSNQANVEKPEDDPFSSGILATLPEATAGLVVPNMNFTGTPTNLSLKDAIQLIQTTGPGFQTAEINRQAARATSLGHGEMNSTYKEMGESSSSVARKLEQLQRDFAKAQMEPNYQAEMNRLESKIVEQYFTVLQAQEALKISTDYMAIQQKNLSNVQLKYQQGRAAQNDVKAAETALAESQQSLLEAQHTLNQVKMNLNNMLGNPVMQAVNLTDTLKAADAPQMNLATDIQTALDNRNEIKRTALNVTVQEMALLSLAVQYPSNSAKYLNQQVALLQAQDSYKTTIENIEIDVRTKYMDIQAKANNIQAITVAVASAKDAQYAAEVRYEAGLSTLPEMQLTQIETFQKEQQLSKAILDYNLAVYAYQFAIGVGIEPAGLM